MLSNRVSVNWSVDDRKEPKVSAREKKKWYDQIKVNDYL